MHFIKNFILLAGDVFFLYAALIISLLVRYFGDPFLTRKLEVHLPVFSVVFVFWLLFFGAAGLYDLRLIKNSKNFLYRLVRAMLINTILAVVIFYTFPLQLEPRRNLLLIAILSTALIFSWRYLFNLLVIRASSSRVLFLGLNKEVADLAEFLTKNRQLGQIPVGIASARQKIQDISFSFPVYSLDEKGDLNKLAREKKVDTVVITPEIRESKKTVKELMMAASGGILVTDFSNFYETLTGKITLSLIKETWFLDNLIGFKKKTYEFPKRVLDIILASVFGVLAAIIFPLVALAIKIESKGPIFFKQARVGKNKKEFKIIKFRSMVAEAEKMGDFKGNGKDARHTGVGKFLRKSYLDELPQVVNVLKGEMSFIGPRPERPKYVEELSQKVPFYEMRLLVQPGITGWAQINMENDASVEDAAEKMQYDLYYVKNRSLVLDLLVSLRTVYILLRRKGR